MFVKLAKATPNVFPQALRRTFPKKLTSPIRNFSSSFQPIGLTQKLPYQAQDTTLDDLPSINPHVTTYMKELYQYLAAASVIGVSSASLLALTAPLGFPSAFLILTGFGLQHVGSEYVDRTRPQSFVYKDAEGRIQYGSANSPIRKLGFLASCLGYSCIMGSLLGMIPLAPAALPVSALTCMFSTLGHLGYCKFATKANFKPINLIISGMFTGVLGLNFLTSTATMTMWESVLHLQNLEAGSYLGMLLYNLFTGYDSQKTMEDIRNKKGDYLKHASKFSENWLYSLIPYFLISLLPRFLML